LSGLVDAVPSALARRDVRTIALIGLAHGCSHFFQLVLPPLFPLLVAELGVTYTELGAAMTAFFLASGIGQPLAGLLVDRFGARDVLLLGLGIYVLAVLGMAAASSVPTLICAMLLAGIGNCVFHPADYTLLSASVRSTHLGRAYGVHTLGGNLGWAIAPVFMLSLAGLLGWRAALVSAATLGAMVWLSLWSMRACLRDESDERVAVQPAGPTALTVLLSPAVTLCFGYFALLAAALIAVQNFLPPVLAALYRTPLVLGGAALTGFLLGASAGVVAGGIVADRGAPNAVVIAAGLAGSALLFATLAHVALPAALLVGVLFAAGFLSGLTTPSRDLLVRSATPPGATGRVFGFVYSGLDVGAALAPVTVGMMIDHGHPRWALWAVALLLLAAIGTAVSVRVAVPGARSATT
jgi:MFS family permease